MKDCTEQTIDYLQLGIWASENGYVSARVSHYHPGGVGRCEPPDVYQDLAIGELLAILEAWSVDLEGPVHLSGQLRLPSS